MRITKTRRSRTANSPIRHRRPPGARIVRRLLSAALAAGVAGSLTLLGLAQPAAAAGVTWYVDQAAGQSTACDGPGPDACAEINQALDVAGFGDTIAIAAGEYDEVLLINKSVSLQGASAESVVLRGYDDSSVAAAILFTGADTDASISGMTLTVEPSSVPVAFVGFGAQATLTDVVVRGNPGDVPPSFGVGVGNGKVQIVDSTITETAVGVQALAGGTATITGGELSSNQFAGVAVQDADVTVTLTGTSVVDNGHGIDDSYAGGISLRQAGTVVATGVTISGNRAGIMAERGGNLTVIDSVVQNNSGSEPGDSRGISGQAGTDPTPAPLQVELTRTAVSGHAVGVQLLDADARITDSTITDNTSNGIYVKDDLQNEAISSHLVLSGSTVSNNGGQRTSSVPPAGLLLDSGTAEVTDTQITGNGYSGVSVLAGQATFRGGAVSNNGMTGVQVGAQGSADLTGTTVSGNGLNADQPLVAGLVLQGGSITGTGVTMDGNANGALMLGGGTFTLSDSAIRNSGGGDDLLSGYGVLTGGDGTITPSVLTVTGTEVSGNVVGVYLLPNSTNLISNSTIADNAQIGVGVASPGGAPENPATLVLTASTIAGNSQDPPGEVPSSGLAIDVPSTVVLGGTIIQAPEAADACQFGVEPASALHDGGYNVVSDDTCTPMTAETSLAGVDAQLGPLADNGGPNSTMLPAGTSPVAGLIPAGAQLVVPDGIRVDDHDLCAAGAVDQRGEPRPQGQGCEAGAVEILDAAPVPPLVIDTESLPAGTAGQTYSATLAASGGTDADDQWTLVDGSLPDGLTLSAAGEISGEPTVAGDFAFTVQVAEEANPPVPATKDFTISVAPQPLQIVTESLPAGTAGEPYAGVLEATGGNGGPYSWAITDGDLPAGMDIDPVTGEISGTPTGSGDATFTVQLSEPDQAPVTTVVPGPAGGPGDGLRNTGPAFRVALAAAPAPVTKEFTISIAAAPVTTKPTTTEPTTTEPTTTEPTTTEPTTTETPTASDTATDTATVTSADTATESTEPTATGTTSPSTVAPSTTTPSSNVAPPPAAPSNSDDLANTGLDVGSGLAAGALILVLGVGLVLLGRPRRRGTHQS